jgi:hypothetical protein
VLENVLGVNVIDGVVCGVNIRVAVLECRLEDEASRESASGSRAVVRASIPAGAFDVCDVGVLRVSVSAVVLKSAEATTYLVNHTSEVGVQVCVGVVGDQPEALWLASIDGSL